MQIEKDRGLVNDESGPADQTLTIGRHSLKLPSDHKLPYYLSRFPEYDYLYWNIIGSLLRENKLFHMGLVDIGANVGDTAAHFRRISDGPIWAIEPDPIYYSYLEKNAPALNNIRVNQALVSPENLVGSVRLSTTGGTGASSLTEGELFTGPYLEPAKLIAKAPQNYILKSDTDGFDGQIISALTEEMQAQGRFASIIAFEGPTRIQMGEHDIASHLDALIELQMLGYQVQILSNIGQPVAFVGASADALRWQFEALTARIDAQNFNCPYFDFICVGPELSVHTFGFNAETRRRLWADLASI